MRQRLRYLWELIGTTVWILPLTMGVLGLAGAGASLWIDQAYPIALGDWLPSAEAVRTVLAAAAGGIIGLAGVSVSMAMVALTLAAGQFGPRLLRQYLQRSDQKLVLGVFLAAFLFDLAAIAGTTAESPSATITLILASVLTLASLGGFVLFVHQIASSLHADQVIALIGEDLERVLDEMLAGEPTGGEGDGRDSERDWQAATTGLGVHGTTVEMTGYVETVDYSALVELARERASPIETSIRAGDFVLPESPLAQIFTVDAPDEAFVAKLRKAVIVGRQPTPVQDVEYPISQIMQVAARALSPGINDPLTAIACIDWLSAALARAARSHLPEYCFRDADGRLWVRGRGTDFAGMMGAVFDPLRQYARGNVQVTLRCLEALNRLAGAARDRGRLEVIAMHARRIAAEHERTFQADADRAALEGRLQRLREVIGDPEHLS